MNKLLQEPVLAAALGSVGVNVAQILVLPIPSWAHALLLVLAIIGPSLGARHVVTPVASHADNPIYGPGPAGETKP